MATISLSSDVVQVGSGGGAPAFQNSWANLAGGFATASYWKDSHGHVHLDGLVKSGAANTTIFTLPAGYLPALRETYAVMTGGDVVGRLDVAPNGDVVVVTFGTNAYVSLSGITFLAQG